MENKLKVEDLNFIITDNNYNSTIEIKCKVKNTDNVIDEISISNFRGDFKYIMYHGKVISVVESNLCREDLINIAVDFLTAFLANNDIICVV